MREENYCRSSGFGSYKRRDLHPGREKHASKQQALVTSTNIIRSTRIRSSRCRLLVMYHTVQALRWTSFAICAFAVRATLISSLDPRWLRVDKAMRV